MTDSPLKDLERNVKIDDLLGRALRRLNRILRKKDLPMGIKEDLSQAIDDLDTAVETNDVSRDAKVAALQAQIDLLSANPTEPEVRAAIERLTAAKDKLLADAE